MNLKSRNSNQRRVSAIHGRVALSTFMVASLVVPIVIVFPFIFSIFIGDDYRAVQAGWAQSILREFVDNGYGYPGQVVGITAIGVALAAFGSRRSESLTWGEEDEAGDVRNYVDFLNLIFAAYFSTVALSSLTRFVSVGPRETSLGVVFISPLGTFICILTSASMGPSRFSRSKAREENMLEREKVKELLDSLRDGATDRGRNPYTIVCGCAILLVAVLSVVTSISRLPYEIIAGFLVVSCTYGIICTLFLVYLRVSSWSNWLRGRNANRGLYILLRILEALSVGMAVAVTGALSASSGSSISLPDLITVGVLVVIVFVAIEKFVYSSSRLGEAIKVALRGSW